MPLEMLYLVLGSTGTYDMHTKWVVAAFLSLEAAEAHKVLATNASLAAVAAYKKSEEGRGRQYVYFDAPTKYDLAHRVYDTDVRYYVEPVPLVNGALPASGLLGIADALASAEGLARESNNPGLSQRMRKAPPAPAVDVRSDFGSKLKAVLQD